MKADIHPEYKEVTITCACGATYNTRSTSGSDFNIDICSNCHPVYTGKERRAEAKGRVERFMKRYGKGDSPSA